ncbi:hypothetical protein L596_009788 [Steinernema carpocapsae]|uniref:Uncharacterized protein n=1 Tax=Steinernema carpocapsae TaxID=34508 RepID=A0A4U5PGC4_STECR|nr:hypothetical protein L596_009788 [Steinernema carpocapsae]
MQGESTRAPEPIAGLTLFEVTCQTEPQDLQNEEGDPAQLVEELPNEAEEDQVERRADESTDESAEASTGQPVFQPTAVQPALPIYSEPPPAYLLNNEKRTDQR